MRDQLTAIIDAQEASSAYDSEEECTLFPNGDPWARCTCWAYGVEAQLGPDRVKVMGFSNDENPTAQVAAAIFGHDFAVVDGRFIVDGWVKYVGSAEGTQPGVYDMNDEKDAEMIRTLYGDPECWSWLDDPSPRFKL